MGSAAHASISSTQPWPLQPLFDQLTQAAREDDRAEFDRLFDCCFGWVYAIAWRLTGDQARAEAITTQILCDAMNEAA